MQWPLSKKSVQDRPDFRKISKILRFSLALIKCWFQFYLSERLNGLQVNWVFDREFTKSLIIRDFDDMTSPSKFGKVTWPTLDSMGRSVFYRPAFSAFYRLFCKIANLWDIDLKFSGFISDVNIDIPAKFREVSMPRNCISKNRDFRDFFL